MFKSLKHWISTHRTRPLEELLAVEFDSDMIRVRVLDRFDPEWNQECRWADITRVCFRDEGAYRSDVIYLDVRGQDKPVEFPVEARGGNALFAELSTRGLFPQPVLGDAIRSGDGGLYCWPPSHVAGG